MTKWKCIICYKDADVISDASTWCKDCHQAWTRTQPAPSKVQNPALDALIEERRK